MIALAAVTIGCGVAAALVYFAVVCGIGRLLRGPTADDVDVELIMLGDPMRLDDEQYQAFVERSARLLVCEYGEIERGCTLVTAGAMAVWDGERWVRQD